jgi:P4 family phage/plasmid primase-like protien
MSNHKDANGRLASAATWYANIDWKILPCYGIIDGRCTCSQPHAEPKDMGKHPSIDQWNTRATSDVNQISNWWNSNPENNIGVYCAPSGFFVIDIDPRSGGVESFDKFESYVDGALPPTVEAFTGEYNVQGKIVRGRHLFYKCDPTEELVGNLIKAGFKGVDIKHNGYVLISPSRHFSGNCYDWKSGHAPWEIEMAEAPEELLSVIRKRSRKIGSRTSLGTTDWDEIFGDLDYEKDRVDIERMMKEGIDEGSRAVDIYKLTCALANKYGVEDDLKKKAIEVLMMEFNHTKVRPPLPLEGTNGLLHHVRRAIDFVSANPIIGKIAPKTLEWLQTTGRKISENSGTETKTVERSLQPLTGVVRPQIVTTNAALPGTIAGSIAESIENGDSISFATSLHNMDVPLDPDAVSENDGGEIGGRSMTDTGNGRRLIDTFGQIIRYSEGLGWFQWDGTCWLPDKEALGVQELAKNLASIISQETKNYESNTDKQMEIIKFAHSSKSNARIDASIKSANSDPRIMVPVEKWDSDENLIGVANGVIDLKTGELLKGRPDLYISKRAPVSYSPGIRNIRWEQFIDFATGGDKELQDWIQRAAGYTLTGSRKYDVMFLVYGPAGSGKNTLVEAIVKALGTDQYAFPFDSTILAQGDGKANSSDLYHWAELRGKRMIWVDELPDSERLKENSVKKLTGSSEISARSPGGRPFSFSSRAKLWITTNHRPIINDDAMWRRIRAIPLTKVPETSDPDLKEYIFSPEGALPAVLAWAVEGAVKILSSSSRDALGMCTAVKEASEMYRKTEDRIGMFLDEETNAVDGAVVSIKELYGTYQIWSDSRGERAMTQIAFDKKLRERGFDVVGNGSQAIINNLSQKPRAVRSPEENWSHLTRSASFNKY